MGWQNGMLKWIFYSTEHYAAWRPFHHGSQVCLCFSLQFHARPEHKAIWSPPQHRPQILGSDLVVGFHRKIPRSLDGLESRVLNIFQSMLDGMERIPPGAASVDVLAQQLLLARTHGYLLASQTGE